MIGRDIRHTSRLTVYRGGAARTSPSLVLKGHSLLCNNGLYTEARICIGILLKKLQARAISAWDSQRPQTMCLEVCEDNLQVN